MRSCMRSFFIPAVAALNLALLSVTASAAPYIGFGIGSAFYKVDLSGLAGNTFTLDDNSTGTKLYGGYRFNDYIAAELAVYKFAESSIGSFIFTGGATVSGAVKSTGAAAYAVGRYPVSKKIKLGGKLGVLKWDADLRVNNTTGSNNGTDLAYGLFASYAFTKQLAVQAEWEKFNSDNPELSLFTVGFRFDFK